MTQERGFTPGQRIDELSTINQDVSKLVTSAGQAIHALTNRPLNLHASEDDDDERMSGNSNETIEDRKTKFKDNTESFFVHAQSIFAVLRRQMIALEEAGIITPDPQASPEQPKTVQPPAQASPRGFAPVPKEQQLDPDRIKNGGLGHLDIGWLNSRGNKVGAEKEAELMQEAKTLLEDVLSGEDSVD
ncbi:Mediator of RNA polymerase II transcription subunit 11 [Cercospora zeina]